VVKYQADEKRNSLVSVVHQQHHSIFSVKVCIKFLKHFPDCSNIVEDLMFNKKFGTFKKIN